MHCWDIVWFLTVRINGDTQRKVRLSASQWPQRVHFLDGWFRIFHEVNVKLVKLVTMKMIHVARVSFPWEINSCLIAK